MNTITFSNGKKIEVEPYTKLEDLLGNFENTKDEIVALRVNNEICPLVKRIDINATVEPVMLKSSEGSAIYRRSLCFVLAAASHNVFPQKRLLVGHSLGHGYYYTIDEQKELSENDINVLKNEMQRLVNANLRIEQKCLSYEDAVRLIDDMGLVETRKQLNYICHPKFLINTLENFSDLYFDPLVLKTGILKTFDLLKYNEGFILRYPATDSPYELTEFIDIPQLFNVYKLYKQWGKQLNVTSAGSLNQLVAERKAKDFIDITELLQTKRIADIANQIQMRQNVKLVLMAGPSSSGKTTTSKKLALQLMAIGYHPKLVELDSYYLERDKTPRDENGDYDYECLESLDIAQLNQDLVEMFSGKSVKIPTYNFKEGKRYYTGKEIKLEGNDILIMEGIHGLNEKLTPLLPSDKKFTIYLSALTQLNLDDHNRISTTDNRLIRRIVRDSQFRGKSAAETIKMWPSVNRGEKLHIFPFQDKADVMLNTALDYELSVLKNYAIPLLRCVSPMEKEYSEAARLIRFLNCFVSIPGSLVPGKSIIREFIGGSDFKY